MTAAGGRRQVSLERLRRFGITPIRERGQNFLIDDNMLGVIARESQLGHGDVVLEVGGGLGVLSEHIADRAKFVHVFEIDRRLEPALREALAGRANVNLQFSDAVRADFEQLKPVPGKMISNLPYGVATPVILKSIRELPQIELWCVMVQREVAARLAAKPGNKEYGSPSVMTQISCVIDVVRPVSRKIFTPEPNVDSALVVMHRYAPAAERAVEMLVRAAFAHRRKTLPGSVALSAEADPTICAEMGAESAAKLRAACAAALLKIAEPENQRAERLSPRQFVELADAVRGK